MLIIDRYSYTNRLTDSNPNLKFGLVSVSLILAIGFKNIYLNTLIFVFMSTLIIALARIPLKAYLKVLKIPLAFLTLSMITILISFSKTDIFLYSFKLLDFYIGIVETSLELSLKLFFTVLASLSASFFLSLTTPLVDIIKVFKAIKIPNSIIELLVLIYRFIFIFLEESKAIYHAQEIRFGYISFKKGIESTALLLRSLLLRVFSRYKDMSIALDCKLFDGEFKTGD